MMRMPVRIPAAMLLLISAGCSSGNDPNYSKEIKLTEADKQKMQQTMAGQVPPGTVTAGQPIQGLKAPPGKGR